MKRLYSKAQVWGIDIMVGVVIFTAAIIAALLYLAQFYDANSGEFNDLANDANTISSSLLSGGYPDDWNSSDAVMAGLTNDNMRLNETKWGNFSAMGYSMSKRLLGTRNDYLVFFVDEENNVIDIGGSSYAGKPSVTRDNFASQDTEGTVQVSRFLLHNATDGNSYKMIKMVVYVWT